MWTYRGLVLPGEQKRGADVQRSLVLDLTLALVQVEAVEVAGESQRSGSGGDRTSLLAPKL